MRKLNTFLYVFKNSAFKPSYYSDVIKAPFKFSLKYFLFLFLTLSLLTSLAISFFINQDVKPFVNKLESQLPSFYPSELTIKVENGQVKTNVAEPFFIPLRPEYFPDDISKDLKKLPIQNILVIDTQADPGNISEYQTFALLTKDAIAFQQDRNEIRIQSLKDIKDFTINEQRVLDVVKKILPYFRWIIPVIILILMLIIPSITIASKLIYLLLISIISFIIIKLLKHKKIGYKKALQVNLHAITLPTIVVAFFQLLGVNPQIPFFQTIVLVIFNLIIYTSINPKKK
ncbi:DUF1189 family protein [Patescibacteria group bacterium]